MTFDAALLSAFTIVKLALATWLFSPLKKTGLWQ